jgi:hypothetical protein
VNGIRAQRDRGIEVACLQELHQKGRAMAQYSSSSKTLNPGA